MESIAVVGMDIHKKFTRAVSLDAKGDVLEMRDVFHGNKESMSVFFRGLPKRTHVVMEATFGWPWVSDLAQAEGLEPVLAQANRAREMARGMSKTDRRDAIWLGKLWLTGGPVFPEAYRASPEVRGLRGLFRNRSLLVSMQTQIKNSIHGVLLSEGVSVEDASDAFSPKGLGLMEHLDLTARGRQESQDKLEVLSDLRKHILKLEGRINQKLKADPRSELLMTIPGVGKLTAFGLLAELGDIGRFPNARALAAYAGVLPLNRESAGKDFGKKTGNNCNQHLRWALIEAVTGAVRSSARFRSLHSRVKARNKKAPGKARVAVARELAEVVYLILKRGVPYVERPSASCGTPKNIHPNRASQGIGSADPTRGQAA